MQPDRLEIATRMAAALLGGPETMFRKTREEAVRAVVELAFEYADEIIRQTSLVAKSQGKRDTAPEYVSFPRD